MTYCRQENIEVEGETVSPRALRKELFKANYNLGRYRVRYSILKKELSLTRQMTPVRHLRAYWRVSTRGARNFP